MGYSTDYSGSVTVVPPIDTKLQAFLAKLADTRRIKRDVVKLKKKFKKGAGGLDGKYGTEGEFFVGGNGFMGQDDDNTVIDGNQPPCTQPGLWLQWVVNDDGTEIEWDGNEKFYYGLEWMQYLIDVILAPRGYVCNGEIEAHGDDYDDVWKIVVTDNVVKMLQGTMTFVEVPDAVKIELEVK